MLRRSCFDIGLRFFTLFISAYRSNCVLKRYYYVPIGQIACCISCQLFWQFVNICISLPRSLKHSEALRGCNSARNRIAANDKHGRIHRLCVSCFFMLRVCLNAKKNPMMNRLRFFKVIPLWLFRFLFRSVNVPSILLFVFGIPGHS